jgi:hypothetical protein
MKTLLYQNSILITKKRRYEVFVCKNCGAIFESDEYENLENIIRDTCITCKNFCIIKKEKKTNEDYFHED